MEHILYGDGIHDDTQAIQELLDKQKDVVLPSPKKFYLISKPLEIGSGTSLTLPRNAVIRLADNSNCLMLKNKTVTENDEESNYMFVRTNPGENIPYCKMCENIEIKGGIWDFNNKGQLGNPIFTGERPGGYLGLCALFYNVKNLHISDLTFKDPINFALTLDTVSFFNIDNITFDFNDGNPYQATMDGIHLNGNCHMGTISNLFGSCYDDTVAMNSEEGSRGEISDITVKGIYTDYSHSAVRLLSSRPEAKVKNIHISDVHGKFYQFTVSLMRCYATNLRGCFENIVIDNIFASKADRGLVKYPRVHSYRVYPIIDVQSYVDIKNLKISNLHREETFLANPTVQIEGQVNIHNMYLENITSENLIDGGEIKTVLVESPTTKITYFNADRIFENGKEVKIDL